MEEKKKCRIKLKVNAWNLRQKLSFFLSAMILLTALATLVISTVSETFYMTKQSKEMVREQLDTLVSNYNNTLIQYEKLAMALIINPSVQDYCKKASETSGNVQSYAGEVYNYMTTMINMENNMNFAVVLADSGDYIYKGNSSMLDTGFFDVYEADYKESVPMQQESTVRMNYNRNYFRGGLDTLTIYYPIYSVDSAVGGKTGMLILNFKDRMLEQMYEDSFSEIKQFVTDAEGRKIFSQDKQERTELVSYADKIEGKSGSFQEKGRLVNYQKISGWNFYFINETSLWDVYRDSVQVGGILLCGILAVTFFAILILRKMIASFYKPINRVVTAMDEVSEGNLDNRIGLENVDMDSQKLAQGFNEMMDQIVVLMEQVKEEQHQLEQARLNVLYAQIKPHFLYNTLDCIHWQAVADGNENVSTMVKALAQYYRSCLSRGKEIISLRQELDHIQSYLIIQNMRYDNIIELENQIPEKYYDICIPKMTLQPLVENVIYHGIRPKETKDGRIRLFIEETDACVHLTVWDNGLGISEEKIQDFNRALSLAKETYGYGVGNVNKRIRFAFGEEYGLKFGRNEAGGTSVEVILPLKSIYEDEQEESNVQASDRG